MLNLKADEGFTLNEVREAFGLPPTEDGEWRLLYTPHGIIPFDDRYLYLWLFEIMKETE